MNWKESLKNNITTVAALREHITITDEEAVKIQDIIESYPMSIPGYYLSLIDKNDPQDPIKKMCIPSVYEMNLDGELDTSGELSNTKEVGLQHKYPQTALVLSTNLCAMYCRHCFRKRLVGQSDEEIAKAFDAIFDYITDHKEITNILISGGDSLLNSNNILEYYLKKLTSVPHLKLIRFGTRTPVVLPSRIYEDSELLNILKKYSSIKPIYFVTQFNHPRELTEEAKKAVDSLTDNGIVVSNQTVLLKGINDNPEVMIELINRLNQFKIIPYYIFQCRPVSGVKSQFQVPIKKGYSITEETKAHLNGHGKRFRFIMSHESGKIEIIGTLPSGETIFKYHQAKNPADNGSIFIRNIDDNQCWL
ncbi:MAG: KamA family radical SAM protein [Clostridiaceae bacterium]